MLRAGRSRAGSNAGVLHAMPAGIASSSSRPEQPLVWAGVDSEVGRLRSVLVHRPGDELLAVGATNAARMLYAGPVDLTRAQVEHDAFVEVLRAQGVEVLYLEQLVAEVIEQHPERERLLELLPPGSLASVRERLASLPPGRLARALIGGIPAAGAKPNSAERAWLVDPLPNLMFTRDPSAWIGRRVMLGEMAAPVRRRESLLTDLVYRRHPRFVALVRQIGSAGRPLRVEGGDVLMAGDGRVIVGVSSRTSAAAAHRFASALLTERVASEVLTVRVPRLAGFHLDLVLSIVDREAIAVWAPTRRLLRAHAWRATSRGVAVHAVPDPLRWLSASCRVIRIAPPLGAAHARAWDHGLNVLAVAPGVVIAYADNYEANARLRAAGVEVIPVAGSALGRGCGGPRCLTCPVAREPVVDASPRWATAPASA